MLHRGMEIEPNQIVFPSRRHPVHTMCLMLSCSKIILSLTFFHVAREQQVLPNNLIIIMTLFLTKENLKKNGSNSCTECYLSCHVMLTYWNIFVGRELCLDIWILHWAAGTKQQFGHIHPCMVANTHEPIGEATETRTRAISNKASSKSKRSKKINWAQIRQEKRVQQTKAARITETQNHRSILA